MKATKKDTQKKIRWAAIVETLEVWRKELDDPSVTTIAEYYAKSAWAVLASTILSLRTKDAVTLEASKRLLAKAASPAALLTLQAAEIEKLIYPAGFYKTKAANLLKIAHILIEKYAGEVPADIDTLLELPGVGRKTANLVCIEAFDMDGICVDTHVHRISNRMGWVLTKMPDDTETALRAILPRQFWKPINPLLVLFGQNVCKPIGPKCSACPVSTYCEKLITKPSKSAD